MSEVEEQSHDLMTAKEVAARLRVKPNTVYAWLRAGILPSFKIGGTWRVHRRELESRIQNGGGGVTTS